MTIENTKTVAVTQTRCPQNHRCPLVRLCPAGAISQDGLRAPVINQELCTGCGKCVRSCPTGALSFR